MNGILMIPAVTAAVSVGLGCGTCCSPIISTFLSSYVVSHAGGVKKAPVFQSPAVFPGGHEHDRCGYDSPLVYGIGPEKEMRGLQGMREEIFVITKLYPNQFSDAEAAIDEALDKLDIQYIDMMLLHHPGTGDVDAYLAMEKAVADGKIRSIGLSNWYVEELEEFLPQVNITPALVQNEIHPYYQENDVIPYIQELGIVVQGWYPLGGRGHTAELLGDAVISEIAAAHGKSSA